MSKMIGKTILFAGPSLFGLRKDFLADCPVILKPPAIRGDIDNLLEEAPGPGTIILADGIFHSELSVGHAELRRALREGWVVWGVSSMGAIRACEMYHMGMRGFGRVFEFFVADAEFTDDEVTLLHAPMAPYFPISEPLIHMRLLLDHLVATKIVTADSASVIVKSLKNRWFGFRTLDLLGELLTQYGEVKGETHAKCMIMQAEFRVKTHDIADLLTTHFHARL